MRNTDSVSLMLLDMVHAQLIACSASDECHWQSKKRKSVRFGHEEKPKRVLPSIYQRSHPVYHFCCVRSRFPIVLSDCSAYGVMEVLDISQVTIELTRQIGVAAASPKPKRT